MKRLAFVLLALSLAGCPEQSPTPAPPAPPAPASQPALEAPPAVEAPAPDPGETAAKLPLARYYALPG